MTGQRLAHTCPAAVVVYADGGGHAKLDAARAHHLKVNGHRCGREGLSAPTLAAEAGSRSDRTADGPTRNAAVQEQGPAAALCAPVSALPATLQPCCLRKMAAGPRPWLASEDGTDAPMSISTRRPRRTGTANLGLHRQELQQRRPPRAKIAAATAVVTRRPWNPTRPCCS